MEHNPRKRTAKIFVVSIAIAILLLVSSLYAQEGSPSVEGDEHWWDGFGSAGMNNQVFPLMVYDTALIAGGDFTLAGGVPANRIARWNGTSWDSLGSGVNGRDMALGVYNGQLVTGGSFTQAGGNVVNRIARWDGASWSSFGSGMSDRVNALLVYNGELIAGGATAKYIAKWNGSSWGPLGSGMNDWVRKLAIYNGELIAGGDFSQADGNTVNYITRWNGSSWDSLKSGVNGYVYALGIYNAELIVGGSFSQAGGVPANNIARWNGTRWDSLGSGVNYHIYDIKEYNGKLIVCGEFTQAGGNPANYIAQWDGSSWSSLGSGTVGWVYSLAVFGTSLYAGGSFGTAGNRPSNFIARWDPSIVPVTLSDMSVVRDGKKARLWWKVTGLAQDVGFHIYREERGHVPTQITREPLTDSHEFEFVDEDAPTSEVFYWLVELARDGTTGWHGPLRLPPISGVVPARNLFQNSPNPFKNKSKFTYSLAASSSVLLTVHDAQGRKVAALVSEVKNAGEYSVSWDARDEKGKMLPSGVYIARFEAGTEIQTQKMVLVR